MTSKQPPTDSKQGLTNSERECNLTQQSIVTYMSISSQNNLKTTEKIKKVKTPQKYKPNTTPNQTGAPPILRHSHPYNNSDIITNTNLKVNHYKIRNPRVT
jgi:hypothetical protein